MGYSKVIYNGETLINLTNDDVTAENLLKGIKAHDSNGDAITGTCEYDIKSEGFTAVATEILKDKTAGVGGQKVTGTMPNNGAVTGTIKTKDGKYTIPKGYHDGSGTVGLDETEKGKLKAENIRENVTIFGVTGTMSGNESENPQPKIEVEAPLTEDVTITPEGDYTCLSEVVVKKVPYQEIDNTSDNKGITVVIG
jgi:hypothetical protein